MTRTQLLQGLGWAVFAVFLVAIGMVFLAACDLNIRPLFGLRYCMSSADPPDLRAERVRERELRARIHEAELRLAQLPICKAEDRGQGVKPDIKPPENDTKPPENDTKPPENDTKPPENDTKPSEKDASTPENEAELKMPSRLEDLRGCWQSIRGDIDVRTDDKYLKLVGRVRLCFCFGSNGRGKVTWYFTDGRSCETDLTATIESDELHMAHETARCTDPHVIVPERITCKGQPGGDTECDRRRLGQMRRRTVEKYKRVSEEYCRRL